MIKLTCIASATSSMRRIWLMASLVGALMKGRIWYCSPPSFRQRWRQIRYSTVRRCVVSLFHRSRSHRTHSHAPAATFRLLLLLLLLLLLWGLLTLNLDILATIAGLILLHLFEIAQCSLWRGKRSFYYVNLIDSIVKFGWNFFIIYLCVILTYTNITWPSLKLKISMQHTDHATLCCSLFKIDRDIQGGTVFFLFFFT